MDNNFKVIDHQPKNIKDWTIATTSNDLQEDIIDCLVEAISTIHSLLDRHIANREGQESSGFLDPHQDLEEICQVLEESVTLRSLRQTFDLSLFECSIILCCVGQAIHPLFPNLLAIAHNDAEQNYLTFQLALACFPQPHWDALTEAHPLRKWQLIHYAASPELPRASLQIDEAVLQYLMGESYHDPILTGTITPVQKFTATVLQPSYKSIIHQAVSVFQGASRNQPIIQLCNRVRELQREIATHISQYLHLPLYHLPSDAIPRDRQDLQRLVMRWQRWCALSPSLLLVEVNESETTESRPSLLSPFLQSLQVPVIVATDERLPLLHTVNFDVEALQYGEQLELWQKAWQDYPEALEPYLSSLAAQFRLSATMIETASAAVRSQLDLPPKVISEKLWEFCRLQARPELEGLAQRINVKTTWEDFILPEREKSILEQILIHVRRQAIVYQNWGFAAKNQRGLGLTALFAGTSGTGKTTAAEVLAHELKLDLFRIDLSAVMSKYIGETEKNLRRIFDAAEKGGGILLFDEADALFGSRTEVKDSHDRHANIEVSYLLQRMEAYQGLAILTSNFKDNLDRAFIRRLRFIVNFPYPKAPERSKIWQRIFPKQTPTEGLDFKRLGQLDITGGNIKSIALNAAFLAADAQKPVKMNHILEATKMEYVKWGRSLTRAETQGWDLS
ncbi:MAG: ATP-binding protein [Roseofilum sp. SBFL]|uniref:ATP-binding protein n=1 Tax=unclassified Roseofilum TaxID=2620099 RepID=UPI001B1B9A30|nr:MULTISPECIES: ATP-binding protein [unclassified Roseofilum]MBP0012731.1 ATP-binding protein [Roseofilum sp. SID3]MBP0023701.1 ATP-binding protein [Roseofilum sp. SID2]MBP0039862.1 ATP-binding protein [Roseofilum sp. SID1]MBP0042919.1 ATP-binding protein [Roseofilum sp. SBFL]